MKDNKSWYEKIGIWVGIVAGICAILGFSVLGGKSIFKGNKADDTSINFENNEIGDQSTVIIGDGNTIHYGDADSENIENSQSDNLPVADTDEFSVSASYDPNTTQTSLTGIDIMVKAETSFPADHVTISAISEDIEVEPMDMHGGSSEWYFKANFYIKGTYTVTITAYNFEGESVSDEFTFVY